MNFTLILLLLVVAVAAAIVGSLITSALRGSDAAGEDNILRERILPNILTISTYVFIIAMTALAADIWAMWAVFDSVGGILKEAQAIEVAEGAVMVTKVVIDVALVSDFIIKALTAFAFHTIAMTALTGLIMIMKDVATAPPSETDGMKSTRLLANILRDKLGMAEEN